MGLKVFIKTLVKKLLLKYYPSFFKTSFYLRLNPPSIFSVEVSLACNLRCPECPMGSGAISRKHEFMSFDRFKIIADKIKPFSNRIEMMYLHIWGEPMLNREIIKMIRYASAFAKTNISTNGLNLTPELSEQLITSGVDTLIVSIDGATQQVYEKYRVGGDLEKALASLKLLAELNEKNGRKVSIIPQFIVFKHNQHEISEFNRICVSMNLTPSFKSPYIRAGSRFENPDDAEYVRKRYDTLEEMKSAMSECQDPKKVFTVLIDGTAVACCYDYEGKTAFGNILEQGVMEIWNSPAYLKFRYDLLNGKPHDYCINNCLMYCMKEKK